MFDWKTNTEIDPADVRPKKPSFSSKYYDDQKQSAESEHRTEAVFALHEIDSIAGVP